MTALKTPLQKVNCPLCDSDRQHQLWKTRDRFDPDAGDAFQVTVCDQCGFIFLNPRPNETEFSAFYASEDYDPFLSSMDSSGLWSRLYKLARTFMLGRKRRNISKHVRSGKLLDIGCGTGEFLSEMQAHGWDVVGVEADERAAAFARDTYGLQIHTTALSETDFKVAFFNVITMWHVLEHLFNPLETLKKISEIMDDGGILFIAAPNINSFDAGFYKSDWVAVDAPRHLLHFTPRSIRRILEAAGMKLIRHKQMPLDAFYNCLMSEKLVWSHRRRSGIWLPFYLVRGVAIAILSIAKAFIDNEGSSVLYSAQKVRRGHDV